MSLAFHRSPNSQIRREELQSAEALHSSLDITVIFTTIGATIAALKRAGGLAKSLSGRITLMVPQIVPYPLPLTSPPVLPEFQEKRFREFAQQSPVEIQVELYLCRDPLDALKTALKPQSLLVIGGPKRWWLSREKRLTRQLRSVGHEVIFTEMD